MESEAEKLDRLIVKVKDFDNENGMYQKELVEQCIPSLTKKGLRLLTAHESRVLFSAKKFYDKYYAYLPLWLNSYVEYKGATCKVIELGKTWETKIPERDGYYKLDKHDLPFGAPSNREDLAAGYLSRVSEYKGFLSRYVRWYGGNGRIVDAYGYRFNCYDRRGVLAVPISSTIVKQKNRPLTAKEKQQWQSMAKRLKAIDAGKKPPAEKIRLMKDELEKMQARLEES